MKCQWIATLFLAQMVSLETSSFAQSLFEHPPTQVRIHSPESTEGLRNRTTITVVVPPDVGNAFGALVLRQLPNLNQWDWGRFEPNVYLGDYSLRGKGTSGLADADVSESEEDLSIQFNPEIQPGQTVNVVFHGFNPQSSIYQWSTELMADGEDSVRCVCPTLRLNVYEQDPCR